MNKKELELYIHIPFCVRKCSYCDFLSAPATEQTREAYMAALFAEIGGRAKDYSDRTVTSIFIGGGTPSLLSGEQIGQLMDDSDNLFVHLRRIKSTGIVLNV